MVMWIVVMAVILIVAAMIGIAVATSSSGIRARGGDYQAAGHVNVVEGSDSQS